MKPETFDFLGFTHYYEQSWKTGWFVLGRKTIKKKLRTKLQEIKAELRKRLHRPIGETGAWLNRLLKERLNYFSVLGNSRSLTRSSTGLLGIGFGHFEDGAKPPDDLGKV